MIGRLRGTLVWKRAPQLLLDVGGVGYELDAPMTTFYALPEAGTNVTLYTHLVVREDAHLLYGFATEAERTLFRELIKVSGVGAKIALAILSGMTADAFAQCVHNNDTASLVRLPGIGKKTAERLVIEMRDRLIEPVTLPGTVAKAVPVAAASPVNDAISALVALGYKPQEASRLVHAVDGDDLPSEEIIRRALRAVASV